MRGNDHITGVGESGYEEFDVIVIGAGAAGRAAARTLGALGARAVLVDRREAAPSTQRPTAGSDKLNAVEELLGTARLVGPGRVEVRGSWGSVTLRARAIILAPGATVAHLGLDGLGVETDPEGYLRVDDRCRTRVPGLFAAGDVTGPPFTVEKALEEGEVAALAAMGKPARVRLDRVT